MICKYCSKDKPEDQFEIARKIGDKVYRRKKCKRCKQDTQNKRRDQTRQWLISYKQTLSCEICGNEDYRVLEFHHLSNKDNNIADMLTYSKDRILEEITKCKVLCANCHRIEHFGD